MILFFLSLFLFIIAFMLYNSEPTLYYTPLMSVIIWLSYILFNHLFNFDFRVFSSGAIFIVFSISILSLGGIFGQIISKKYFFKKHTITINKLISVISGWHYLAMISSLLTLLGLIDLIRYSYKEFELLNNIFSLILLPQEYATDRYGGAQYLPIRLKLLSYMIYPTALSIGALVGGKYWPSFTRIIPILFALSYGLIYSSRTVVILTIISLISSELSIRVLNGKNININFKQLIPLSLLFFIGLPFIFILLQWLRQGFESEFIIEEMISVARISMTGSFSAFTQWFHNYDGLNYEWGRNTFAGPFELFGISKRVQGFYLDFVEVGKSHINIYTAFRGLLQDYGFFGTSIFLFFIGGLSSITYFLVKNGFILAVPILALINGWIIFSPFISLFVNNSIIGGYVLFIFFSFNSIFKPDVIKRKVEFLWS